MKIEPNMKKHTTYTPHKQVSKEVFRGQTQVCVFAYNEALASVTFTGHGASAYLVRVRHYCSDLKE